MKGFIYLSNSQIEIGDLRGGISGESERGGGQKGSGETRFEWDCSHGSVFEVGGALGISSSHEFSVFIPHCMA